MRPTTRARLFLAAGVVLIPVNLALNVVYAFSRACVTFIAELLGVVEQDFYFWYREVYRPARYGSVWDDVDENGRPKAWKQ